MSVPSLEKIPMVDVLTIYDAALADDGDEAGEVG